ncbi:MAG: hypothetical protein ACI4EN_02965 [Butyrivibrio sp.]
MEKYIFGERNGPWYELQGDYYLPCLKLSASQRCPWSYMEKSLQKTHTGFPFASSRGPGAAYLLPLAHGNWN